MPKLIAALFLVIVIVFIASPFIIESNSSKACLSVDEELYVCAASDMAKLSNHGTVQLEHSSLAIEEHALQLEAARNEVIAFQLVLQNRGGKTTRKVNLVAADFISEAGTITSVPNVNIYQAWYHYVDHGGYQWGPSSAVLEWPEYYPDALVPEKSVCAGQEKRLFSSVSISPEKNSLQSVWLDLYIPKEKPAGLYNSTITLSTADGVTLQVPVELTLHNATLPDKPVIDAVGEVYRSYRLEGVGEDFRTADWRDMAHCYQTLAHQHRMIFIERTEVSDDEDWDAYDAIYGPILDGQLFSLENGYVGPGANTPVSIWRTPWPQDYDVKVESPLSDAELNNYVMKAREWTEHATNNGWSNTDYFAYVFDEVDGPDGNEAMTSARKTYLGMAHTQMRRVQEALDQGARDKSIDLMWTSHSDPFEWIGIDELDLSGITRFWVPNGAAASPAFLQRRRRLGERVWFYHNGHPAVGIHSINASGIEMRTWGVIGSRYGFDGQLMWAVNLGSDEQPFARPSYKDEDDRFGNGVMVYPGNQLEKIGFPASPGPIPSMRLKAWRRGLQDAELAELARQNNPKKVNDLLTKIIPKALADGEGEAAWSDDPADWIEFRRVLLTLASGVRTPTL